MTGVPSDTDRQNFNQATTLNLREGSNLDYSFCELIGPKSFDVVVCLTRNKSDKLEQLFHYTPGNCVQFSDNFVTVPFNNSITKMQISMHEERSDHCFPSQHTNFVKKHVSLHDDGIMILSGYEIKNSIIQYCSICLRVRYNLVRVWVPVAVVTIFLIVVTLVVVIVLFCRRYYKGKPL